MSSNLSNTQKRFVNKRVMRKVMGLVKKCILGGFIVLGTVSNSRDIMASVLPQLHAFYQKVKRHWARKNKLNYKATWNYYQAVYACEIVDQQINEFNMVK